MVIKIIVLFSVSFRGWQVIYFVVFRINKFAFLILDRYCKISLSIVNRTASQESIHHYLTFKCGSQLRISTIDVSQVGTTLYNIIYNNTEGYCLSGTVELSHIIFSSSDEKYRVNMYSITTQELLSFKIFVHCSKA